eukprot:14858435-Alexandrium_andersonii.AAC.1
MASFSDFFASSTSLKSTARVQIPRHEVLLPPEGPEALSWQPPLGVLAGMPPSRLGSVVVPLG